MTEWKGYIKIINSLSECKQSSQEKMFQAPGKIQKHLNFLGWITHIYWESYDLVRKLTMKIR